MISGRTTIEKDNANYLGKSFDSLVGSENEMPFAQVLDSTRDKNKMLAASGLVDSDFDFQNESILNLLNPRKSVQALKSELKSHKSPKTRQGSALLTTQSRTEKQERNVKWTM